MNLEGIELYTKEIIESVKGIISVTVVDVDNGHVLAYKSYSSNVDNQLAASFQIEVLRQISRGLNYVDNLSEKDIESMVIKLKDQLHFVFASEDKKKVVHIIANAKETNEGLVKVVHKKYKKDLM